MIPFKVLALIIIIGGLATAGTVYHLYAGYGWSLEMQFMDVERDGDDLIVTVKFTIRNDNPGYALVRSVSISVMNPDRTILFVSEQLAPPAFSVAGSGVTEKIFDIRIQNIASLGTEVYVIVDAVFTVDGQTYTIHEEQYISV